MRSRAIKSLFGLILLIQLLGIEKLEDVSASDPCIYSFDTFAFHVTRRIDESLILPPSSWENEDFLSIIDGFDFNIERIEIIREHENTQELWLIGQIDGQVVWLVHTLGTADVRFVPNEFVLDSRTYYIGDLYVSGSGTIWGFVHPRHNFVDGRPLGTTSRPILMFYDETAQQFKVREGTLELPTDTFPEIILDKQDVFWIVVKDQGIYKFDTVSGETTRVIEALDLEQPLAITLATDTEIIFQVDEPYVEGLYQLHTDTGKLTSIAGPSEIWPAYKGIFMDQLERLWLGANGYRDTNGNWNLIHSNIDGYWETPTIYIRSTPWIFQETSDGKLWFMNWWDGGIRHNGTAWYDPNTGEGCMFTNAPVNVVEDKERNVWFVAGGKLYTISLDDL